MTITRGALMQWALLAASTGTAAAQTNDKLTTVRFIAAVADDMRTYLYAQSAGLFRQAGLDVQYTRAGSGAIVAESIVGGAMDIGKASIISAISAHVRGLPFALIAPGQLYRPTDPIIAAIMVAANSPIRTALDLQGKTVAISAVGDISYLGIRAMIDAAGGDSSTVKWIEVPGPTVSGAIQSGRVDAGLMAEPTMMQDVRAGKLRLLVDMLTSYGGPLLVAVYVTTRDYAAKNRDTVARFANVIERASAYSNTHVAETAALLMPLTGMDATVTAEMHHSYAATAFDPVTIQRVIDLAAKYKVIPQRFDAREMLAMVAPRK
jgi:NitT/TauT family transport system substrate-binding protein